MASNGNNGYTRNFENALNYATGDIIFLADQDDVWLDGKVNDMVNALEKFDFVVSDSIIVNENLETLNESRFTLFNVKNGFLNNFLKTRYIGCSMAFNKKVLDVVLPFPANDKHCPHDFWIALISEFYFDTALINKPLLLYRRHNHNVSAGGFGKGRALKEKIFGRIYCFMELVKRRSKVVKFD